MTLRLVGFLLGAALMAQSAFAGETPSPDGARVYIISPANGATVSSPVTVQFGLSGMGVAPAGLDGAENTGHHHLLIDVTLSGADLDEAVPADDNHRHFGGGQTQTTIDLAPGRHRLQLVLGDANHVPHDPPIMSEIVEITVK